MAKYEKWLGAGLGWVVGGPLGGLLGFVAGTLSERGDKSEAQKLADGVTDFEVNMLVIASHLMKVDAPVSLAEINFVRNLMNAQFDDTKSTKREQILNQCLQREYDLHVACEQMRMYAERGTRVQVVRFMLDLALADGELSEHENYFIFRVAGYLNVNDVDYRKLKAEHLNDKQSAFEILEVSRYATADEVRTAYRKLVLKYHPDRNKTATEAEQKKLAAKFQQVKEAYEEITGRKAV